MTVWSLHFAHLNNTNLLLMFALVMAVFFTLIKARKRLETQLLRFARVVCANVVLVVLIGAWLWGLEFADKGQREVAIDSEIWLAQHQHGTKLLAQYPSLEKLTISGYGFEKHHWQGLAGVEVNYAPKQVSVGFANLNWPKELAIGELFNVQGKWLNPAKPQHVVTVDLLDAAGVKVATTRVRHGETIKLKGVIKAPGNFAFVIQANNDDNQLIDRQMLFVTGLEQIPSQLNILVMQSAPSFEVNQLKHWVGSFGAQMLIFTDMSKERFITQSVNRNNKSLPDQLSPTLLDDMDILIMDGRKLAGLEGNQMEMIERAVDKGLGLLVFADSHFIDSTPSWLEAFSFSPITGIARDRRVLPLVNGVQSEVSFDLISYAFAHANDISFSSAAPFSSSIVLERTHQNRPISLLRNHGLGKVAVSLLNSRYQWQQHQKHHMYSGAWQHIFKNISRVERHRAFLPPKFNEINLVDSKLSVCLLSKTPIVPKGTDTGVGAMQVKVNGQSSLIPLTQDNQQHSRYCTWYWPKQSGWHLFTLSAITSEEDDAKPLSQWRYVYDKQQFQTHQQNHRIQDTHDFVAINKELKERLVPRYHQGVSGHWYWWLLMLCVTYLWFESRQRQ